MRVSLFAKSHFLFGREIKLIVVSRRMSQPRLSLPPAEADPPVVVVHAGAAKLYYTESEPEVEGSAAGVTLAEQWWWPTSVVVDSRPVGRWEDGLCDCCSSPGICCVICCVDPIPTGQLYERSVRMGLIKRWHPLATCMSISVFFVGYAVSEALRLMDHRTQPLASPLKRCPAHADIGTRPTMSSQGCRCTSGDVF